MGTENRCASLPVTPDSDRKGYSFHVEPAWRTSAAAREGVDAVQRRGGGQAPTGESGPGRHGTGIARREGDRRCEIPVSGTSPHLRGSHEQEKVIVVIGPCTEVLLDHRLVLRHGVPCSPAVAITYTPRNPYTAPVDGT
jgi:hypothetical protein